MRIALVSPQRCNDCLDCTQLASARSCSCVPGDGGKRKAGRTEHTGQRVSQHRQKRLNSASAEGSDLSTGVLVRQNIEDTAPLLSDDRHCGR
jgi:hypothetical protein